jgi:hypothetical protein
MMFAEYNEEIKCWPETATQHAVCIAQPGQQEAAGKLILLGRALRAAESRIGSLREPLDTKPSSSFNTWDAQRARDILVKALSLKLIPRSTHVERILAAGPSDVSHGEESLLAVLATDSFIDQSLALFESIAKAPRTRNEKRRVVLGVGAVAIGLGAVAFLAVRGRG